MDPRREFESLNGTYAALRDKALDDAVKMAVGIRERATRLLALATVAEHQRHKVLHGERTGLRPKLNVNPLRRHPDGNSALLRPFKVVRVERLLDAPQLRAAKLRQPVARKVVCGGQANRASVRALRAVRVCLPWRRAHARFLAPTKSTARWYAARESFTSMSSQHRNLPSTMSFCTSRSSIGRRKRGVMTWLSYNPTRPLSEAALSSTAAHLQLARDER